MVDNIETCGTLLEYNKGWFYREKLEFWKDRSRQPGILKATCGLRRVPYPGGLHLWICNKCALKAGIVW